MSLVQMVDAFFRGSDSGHFSCETPTLKEQLDDAIQRFDTSVALKKVSQAKLKRSIKEWSDSENDLSACINKCDDDCNKCTPCQEHNKTYYDYLHDELRDLP